MWINTLEALSTIYYRIFGSKKLFLYEKLILDSWRKCLSKQSMEVFDAQLTDDYFIQRSAADTRVVFYFHDNKHLPLFKRDDTGLHVATIAVEKEGLKPLTAKLFTHHGRIFEIRFPKSLQFEMKQYQEKILNFKLTKIESHVTL